jgi:U3 small nucleolar ribonucleoprotein protein IMP4
VFTKDKGKPHMMEVGPRFELKLYQIKLGTIEQTEVENEWLLRPYHNSAKRRKVMGD